MAVQYTYDADTTTNFYATQTAATPSWDVTDKMSARVIDAAGAQTIYIDNGGFLQLESTVGANTIVFDVLNANQLTVYHDGTDAVFKFGAYDVARIAVSTDTQIIQFSDGSGAALTYDGVSTITLNGVALTVTPAAVTAFTVTNGAVAAVDTDHNQAFSSSDTIAIKFSQSIATADLSLSDLALTNGHSFGTGATLTPANATNGFATDFVVTLGTGATIATGDIITAAKAHLVGSTGIASAANVTFTVPTPAPDAVDLAATGGTQATASVTVNAVEAAAGKSIAPGIQAPIATNIGSIELVLAGAGLDATAGKDQLVLDAAKSLNADFTGSNQTINSVSGLDYDYQAASKTLMIMKHGGGALLPADIDNIVSGILFKTASTTQGDRTVAISYTDIAGNTGPAATQTLTVDTVAPADATIAVTGETNGLNATEATNAVATSITPDMGATLVSAKIGATDLTVVDAATGAYSFDATGLGQGNQTITVVTADAAGNQKTTTKVISIDTVAPADATIAVTGETNGLNATEATTAVATSITPDMGATLVSAKIGATDLTVVDAATGAYSFDATGLGQGNQTITVVTADAAGNEKTTTKVISIDTVAPADVSVIANNNGNTLDAGETLVFTFSEAVGNKADVAALFTGNDLYGIASGGSPTPAQAAWSAGDTVLTVTLGAGETFEPGPTITLTGVQDVAGNSNAVVFTF